MYASEMTLYSWEYIALPMKTYDNYIVTFYHSLATEHLKSRSTTDFY